MAETTDRTIKQSLPVEPADLEACVLDERWNPGWNFRAYPMHGGLMWAVIDSRTHELVTHLAFGIEDAAQAALNEVRE
jgi:hypothetical protein